MDPSNGCENAVDVERREPGRYGAMNLVLNGVWKCKPWYTSKYGSLVVHRKLEKAEQHTRAEKSQTSLKVRLPK